MNYFNKYCFKTRIEQTPVHVPHANIILHTSHAVHVLLIILHSPYHILIQVIDKVDTETCPIRFYQVYDNTAVICIIIRLYRLYIKILLNNNILQSF